MKIRELAGGLQFPEGPVALADGSIVLVEIARGTITRVARDGRVSIVADVGGGPNGLAVGPDGALYLCNNGGFAWKTEADGTLRTNGTAEHYQGGRIERVDLATGRFERLYDSVDGIGLRGPNDLVFDTAGGFYFTDLGKVRARDMDRGGVYYARPDGSAIHTVAHPVMTPNGTALSPDGRTLYVAETEGARLWAFEVTGPGHVNKLPFPSPHGGRCLTAAPGAHYQRFDSIAVDALGNVCVATLIHGGITIVSPDGALVTHVPIADRMVTNLCFGGPQMRTAYVTLSGTGKLIAIDDWPVPGLVLNFNA
jgi:gluconolactonase